MYKHIKDGFNKSKGGSCLDMRKSTIRSVNPFVGYYSSNVFAINL